MDHTHAYDRLSNLLERLQRNTTTEGTTWRLDTITEREKDALVFAVASLVRSAPAPTPGARSNAVTVPPDVPPEARPLVVPTLSRPLPAPIELHMNEGRLKESRRSADVLMCLDFGTARSKAFASRGGRELLPLALGDFAGEDRPYGVTSSIWIDQNGRAFFGKDAMTRSRMSAVPNRRRIDSLKDALSHSRNAAGGIDDPAHRLLNDVLPGANPTDVPLTEGDALLLYLGYLTHLAERALRQEHGVEAFVRRRFAVPCWDAGRRRAGISLLKRYLAQAQVVADSVGERWAGGIDVSNARALLDNVRSIVDADLPSVLVDDGIPEPIAAGGSRIHKGEAQRGLVMVVDVGAGTTDFAVFLVNENPDRDLFKMTPLTEGRGVNYAGNKLDLILTTTILERAKLQGAERTRALLGLELDRRTLKENLFETGAMTARLVTDDEVKLTRDEFLALDECRQFATKLQETFEATLNDVDPTTLRSFRDSGLTVVLTGGGADLPMVRALGNGIGKRRLAPAPRGLHEDLLREYGPLAVAMGGVSLDLPAVGKELGPIDTYTIPNVRPPRGFGG